MAVRVVVTGLVATYPVGGVAWDYLQYVQGFDALGCEVLYLEDTGQWLYDPARSARSPPTRAAGAALPGRGAAAARCRRWRSAGRCAARTATLLGLDEASVARVCAGADLFLNLSGRVLAARRVSRARA